METIVPLILSATFRVEADTLRVAYSVENRSAGVVYLVNPLTRYKDGDGWLPDGEVAYMFFTDEGRIEVCKRVAPQPADRLVTPRTVYVTPLAAGAKYEERLSLPLPLEENRPYRRIVPGQPRREDRDATVELVLGYFPDQPAIVAQPVTVHGVKTHRLARHPDQTAAAKETRPAEVLVRSAPWRGRLPVLFAPEGK